jgi:hypothetical protein
MENGYDVWNWGKARYLKTLVRDAGMLCGSDGNCFPNYIQKS